MIQPATRVKMRVRVHHVTRYGYARPVALGPHVVRLRPADHGRTPLLGYAMHVAPQGEIRWQRDPWNNRIARATFPEGFETSELTVSVEASFDLHPFNPFDFYLDDRCERIPFAYRTAWRTSCNPS